MTRVIGYSHLDWRSLHLSEFVGISLDSITFFD